MQIAQEGLSYSSDNINWVIADYNPSRTLSRMIFINNLFFGTISNNSIYNISYDGINWNDYNYSTSEYWLALIGENGTMFVEVPINWLNGPVDS